MKEILLVDPFGEGQLLSMTHGMSHAVILADDHHASLLLHVSFEVAASFLADQLGIELENVEKRVETAARKRSVVLRTSSSPFRTLRATAFRLCWNQFF